MQDGGSSDYVWDPELRIRTSQRSGQPVTGVHYADILAVYAPSLSELSEEQD